MQFDNLNIWSFVLFIFVNIFLMFFFFVFFIKREKIRKKYFLLFNQNRIFYLKYIFLFLSFFILSFSIFGIKYETNVKKSYSQIDIIFALDVSQSMNSLDYNQNWKTLSRLEYSKNFIKNYILKNPKNRYWLVIFAWEAVSFVPLTRNYSYFLSTLKHLNYTKIPRQWSSLDKAVKTSIIRLFSNSLDNKKVMILLSDWTDSKFSLDLKKDQFFSSFIIWVWKQTFSKIPKWVDIFWNMVYKKYNWKYVETRLNDKSLKLLSSELGGKYFEISDFENKNISFDQETNISSQEYETKDFSRFLSFASFLFFILYLVFNLKIFWSKH